jgi:hypothetical protein
LSMSRWSNFVWRSYIKESSHLWSRKSWSQIAQINIPLYNKKGATRRSLQNRTKILIKLTPTQTKYVQLVP